MAGVESGKRQRGVVGGAGLQEEWEGGVRLNKQPHSKAARCHWITLNLTAT